MCYQLSLLPSTRYINQYRTNTICVPSLQLNDKPTSPPLVLCSRQILLIEHHLGVNNLICLTFTNIDHSVCALWLLLILCGSSCSSIFQLFNLEHKETHQKLLVNQLSFFSLHLVSIVPTAMVRDMASKANTTKYYRTISHHTIFALIINQCDIWIGVGTMKHIRPFNWILCSMFDMLCFAPESFRKSTKIDNRIT